MKSTIQKFSIDKNGNKKKALSAVNKIISANFYVDNLCVSVEGVSATGRHYANTMTLKASDSETAMNQIAVNKLGFAGVSQCMGFGLPILQKPEKRRYGIEIDGKYFFVINTMSDLKSLCTFINI